MNPFLKTDSYKVGHKNLYHPDLTGLYAYYESRGGVFDETVFFGLQGILKSRFTGQFYELEDVDVAEKIFAQHFNQRYFPADAWREMYKDYGGSLPILIKAVPEGTSVPTHNVLFTVESIDPKYAFVVGFVETLLMQTWYPTTIATQSAYLKRELRKLREQHSDNLDGLEFMVHDFGYRGCTSQEQAEIGGASHLTSFMGTDTLAAFEWLNDYYNPSFDGENYKVYGYSVPALEHSVVLSFDTEEECYKHLLEQYPQGIVAAVSDTRDIYNAVSHIWGENFRDDVMKRQGVLVVRPDSGDPQHVVSSILNMLWERFGGTINKKGLRLLDQHVRVIQGDGMNRDSILELYRFIIESGFAPENLTVGAGGGMIQGVNRDTQRFAYKVSEVQRGAIVKPVRKTPITDAGKASKEGRLVLVNDGLGTSAKHLQTLPLYGFNHIHDLLRPVFCNGVIYNEESFETIRARIAETT